MVLCPDCNGIWTVFVICLSSQYHLTLTKHIEIGYYWRRSIASWSEPICIRLAGMMYDAGCITGGPGDTGTRRIGEPGEAKWEKWPKWELYCRERGALCDELTFFTISFVLFALVNYAGRFVALQFRLQHLGKTESCIQGGCILGMHYHLSSKRRL